MARYWFFRIGAAVVPRVPLWLAVPLVRVASWLLWALAGGMRRRVEANLARIPTLAGHPAQVRRAGREAFYHLLLNYLDFFRGPRLSDAQMRAGWTIEGQDLFDARMSEGHGLIIISAHFGNFEFGASRLGAIGHKLLAPAERMRPEPVYQLFCAIRQHHNLRLVPADERETVREITEALRRNEVVLFLVDRHVAGSSVRVPLFGEPTELPAAPVMLALKTGAPLLAAFSWREGRGRSHGLFLPLDLEQTGLGARVQGEGEAAAGSLATQRVRAPEVAARVLRVYLAEMERQIAAHPAQWASVFNPIWTSQDIS